MQIENSKKHKLSYISISDFMQRYYGFPGNSFPLFTHKDLRELLPNIKRTLHSDDFCKMIYTGETILVKDSRGKVVGYDNPYVYCDEMIDNSKVEIMFLIDDVDFTDFDEDDIPYMSDYQLSEALEYFKIKKDNKKVRLILKEFDFRPKVGCKKRKLEKVKLRERLEEE